MVSVGHRAVLTLVRRLAALSPAPVAMSPAARRVEVGAELLESEPDPALDRSDGLVESHRDLAVCQTAEEGEGERVLLRVGERGERGAQESLCVALLDFDVDAVGCRQEGDDRVVAALLNVATVVLA